MSIPTKLSPLGEYNILFDYDTTPLTLTVTNGSGHIKLSCKKSLSNTKSTISGLYYRIYDHSYMGWNKWFQITPSLSPYIQLNTGDIIQFRNTENKLSYSDNDYVYFEMLKESYNNDFKIKASGNIQSMLNYSKTCTDYCYSNMFNGCTLLTTAPTLPATTLAKGCYQNMFGDCSSLTTAPELPSTEMKYGCYEDMFNGCKSLTIAPNLPALLLDEYCYAGMFYKCYSLTTAPSLPAVSLINGCYERMFYGCGSLNYIEVSFISWDTSCTAGWVYEVSDRGTFTKYGSLNETHSHDHIPIGWFVMSK